MSQAGYCAECQANVWLLEGGRCQHGHSAGSITGVYEVGTPTPAAPDESSGSTQALVIVVVAMLSGALIVSAAVAFVVALAAAVGSQPSLPPTEAVAVPDDVSARVSEDYPGWKVVGSKAVSYPEAGVETARYTFIVVPPGYDYSLGVVYSSRGGRRPVSHDEVLRSGGRFHDWSGVLLEHLGREYADTNREMVAVESDLEGSVTVEWTRDTREGSQWHHTAGIDGLWYDAERAQWKNAADSGL